jgi:hypothetical protein
MRPFYLLSAIHLFDMDDGLSRQVLFAARLSLTCIRQQQVRCQVNEKHRIAPSTYVSSLLSASYALSSKTLIASAVFIIAEMCIEKDSGRVSDPILGKNDRSNSYP